MTMQLLALISFGGMVSAQKDEVFTCDESIGKSLVEAKMAEVVKTTATAKADDQPKADDSKLNTKKGK